MIDFAHVGKAIKDLFDDTYDLDFFFLQLQQLTGTRIIPRISYIINCFRINWKPIYLHRKDVLEWVLFKVLNMNINELSEPKICSLALDDTAL